MATYNYEANTGITAGYGKTVEEIAPELVAKAATNVSWNHLGAAKNFGTKEVDGQVKSIHAKSGVEFKAGFQMIQQDGQQKWEGQAKVGEYRLDLQGIENNWANWAVQVKKKSGGSDTIASCLLQANQCFSQRHLVHGLVTSAERQAVCKVTT